MVTAQDLKDLLSMNCNETELQKFDTTHELDTAVTLSGLRFRANFYKTLKTLKLILKKYLSLNSISSVFDSVQKKQSKYGIIPLENNQEGIVQETVDLLGSSQLKIIAELPMSISLSFSTRADDVKKVRKISMN